MLEFYKDKMVAKQAFVVSEEWKNDVQHFFLVHKDINNSFKKLKVFQTINQNLKQQPFFNMQCRRKCAMNVQNLI